MGSDSKEDLNLDDRIQDLRQEKSKSKSAFTRSKNKVQDALRDKVAPAEVRDLLVRMDTAFQTAVSVIEKLSSDYVLAGDRENRKLVLSEMETLEAEFTKTVVLTKYWTVFVPSPLPLTWTYRATTWTYRVTVQSTEILYTRQLHLI